MKIFLVPQASMNPSLPDSMIKDIDKMKGDAIGDTLYSERWVLKTLMKLSKEYSNYCNPDDYHLETSLEEDLSVLWDMTIEPAVAEFLMENNVVELITDVITVSCSPRMNEIMVGILGNLACQEQVRQKIGENEDLIKIIINQLTSSDSPTLIQVMRLINTCIWNLSDKNSKQSNSSDPDKEENESCWISTLKTEKELLQQITCFILASSRNEELLKSTLSLIDSLFNVTDSKDDFFCKTFSTETFVQALVEAVKEMTKGAEDGNKSMYNKEMLKHGLAHWISLLHRLTSHNIGVCALGM
ncbi:hypothetical protein J437_LFUL013154 [Ladona fulva]|uniref:Uncharacterized protein n=1 Tax=Ladona fulva TaxID=123851 RepID=A0A8K0KHY4_LADFU|nr:hypothetical protein J437_LFUL013154 [Ladona fulva]